VPNFAVRAGKRMLLTKGVLQATETHPFKASSRVHPVYFEYPFQQIDDVTLALPAGVRVESTSVPRKAETDFGMYQSFVQRRGDALWIGRKLQIDGIVVNGSAKLVGAVSAVFRRIQSGYVYHYAFVMIVGVFGLLYWWGVR